MPLLEICVDTIGGLEAARRGGADRIELCAALALHGLTPPASLIRAASAQPLPVHLLARPREGDFIYSVADQALVAEDIRTAAEAGLAGVVIGASDADRRLDTTVLARWVDHARALAEARGTPLSLTLHRAFDLAPDLPAALETAVELGFDRILTSGGAWRAPQATGVLGDLQRRAADRIVVMAGSGITPDTLPAIIATGIREFHASGRSRPAATPRAVQDLNFDPISPSETDADVIARMAAMVHRSVVR